MRPTCTSRYVRGRADRCAGASLARVSEPRPAVQVPVVDVHRPPRAGYRGVTAPEARRAARRGWDAYAPEYLAEHGAFLGDADLVWCPEGLREADAALLGPLADLRGRRVLEVGCGAAQGSRWLRGHGVDALGVDLSREMLAAAGRLDDALLAQEGAGGRVPVLQADAAALPLADGSVDHAFSAFGALPFVADVGAVHTEVARVLRPGGRWVAAVNHPMRWVFPDDPDPAALRVVRSYFDEDAYVETDDDGDPCYVETHRTVSAHVRALLGAGFVLAGLVEPTWPGGHDRPWGQWSPERGRLVPGTLLLVARRP